MYYKLSIWLITFVGLLSSCTKETTSDILPTNKEHDILINIVFEKERIVDTKADTPPTIKDCNLYFVNEKLEFVKHYYITSGELLVNLTEGKYWVYVIGNWGTDLGPKSQSELLNMTEGVELLSKNEIYTHFETIDVKADMDFEVRLKSVFAKVNLNLNIEESFRKDFTLESVQLRNVPTTCTLLKLNKPTEGMTDHLIENLSPDEFSLNNTYTMLENAQGQDPNITDQKSKGRFNATNKNCTYFHIKGKKTDGTKIDYYVFLGENNTFDFNSYRNTIYTHNINIYGDDRFDDRVEKINAYIELDSRKMIKINGSVSNSIIMESFNHDGFKRKLSFEYSISGGPGVLLIFGENDYSVSPNTPMTILSNDASQNFTFTYTQSTPGDVVLTYKITDNSPDQFIYETTQKLTYYELP